MRGRLFPGEGVETLGLPYRRIFSASSEFESRRRMARRIDFRVSMSIAHRIFLWLVALLGLGLAPVTLIWGWVRWSRSPRQRDIASLASFSGFMCVSASALIALAGLVYSKAIGGFPFYDPRLLRIIRHGILIATVGLILGLAGIWRRNALRWHCLLAAVGMIAFWIVIAEGE